MLLTILLLSFLPLILVGVFSYYQSKDYIENELVLGEQTNLRKITHTLDMIVKQLLDESRQVMLDPAIEDYIRFPNGAYYEQLEELHPPDMKGYYEYFSVKQKALRRMDVLKLTNPYVDSIYLYDAEKDVVLRSGRVSVPFAEFEDKDWYEPFQNHHTFPVFMRERRTYHNPDQYEKSVITLIHSAWDNPVYKKIALIVNLNADLLYADLFDKMKDDAGASDRYVLFSSDYGLLLGKREDAEEIRRLVEQNGDVEGNMTEGRDGPVLLRSSLELLNWELYNLKSFDRFYAGMNYMKWSLMIAHTIMLVLILILSFLFTGKLYKPIRWLIRFIEKGDSRVVQMPMQGEMKLITSTLLDSVQKSMRLQQTLEESLPAYREKFVLSLIRDADLGRVKNPDADDMKKKWQYLELPFQPHDIVPIVMLARKPLEEEEFDISIGIAKSLHLLELVRASVAQKGQAYVVSLDDERLLLLLNAKAEEMLDVYRWLQKLRWHFLRAANISFIIGVGSHCDGIDQLPGAYAEAAEALRFGILSGEDDIYSIDDVHVGDPRSAKDTDRYEEAVISGIRGGDAEAAEAAFKQLLQALPANSDKLEKWELQETLLRLLGKLMIASDQTGLRSHWQAGKNRNLLDVLYWGSEHEMIRWFERFVVMLAEEVSAMLNEKDNKHIEYIQKRLAEDMTLNLDSISRELKMNPAYVSRIFKEKMNETFIEYLTRIKIEKSKELLEQTDLKVKEIARSLGYESSSYYSAMFKRHTGLTPNKYREWQRKRALHP